MADPLSIIGGFAAVIQISQVVVSYIKAATGAAGERQRLLVGIHATTALCQTLLDTAEIDADQWMHTLQTLSQSESGPLDQFKRNLEYLQKKLVPRKKSKSHLGALASSLKWPFDQDEIREVVADIERQKSLFHIALTNDNLKLSMAILETTQDMADTLNFMETTQRMQGIESSKLVQGMEMNNIQRAEEIQRSQEREDKDRKQTLLSQLTTINFEASHADISSRRAEGTGHWLLRSPEYTSWRDRDSSSVLWCPGLPGAGKTVLASLVISSLHQSEMDSMGIAGMYCSYRDADTTSNLMGSLLRQLLLPMNVVPDTARGPVQDMNGVVATFDDICSHYSGIYLVIDALDECSNAVDLLRQLHRLLEASSANDRGTHVHILVTGRHSVSTTIERHLRPDEQLEISSSEEDVRKFLQQGLRDHEQLSEWVIDNLEFEALIIDSVMARLSGMFLLARLYMDILAHIPTKRGVRKALSTLPTGIDDTYADAWNRVITQEPQQAELGKRILLWVVHTTHPLRKRELQHALAVEEGDDELDLEGLLDAGFLTSFCAGLVVINEQSDMVSLVHPTTQEYFNDRKENLFPAAHEDITRVCITYLRMRPFIDEGALSSREALLKRWSSFPLLGYAAVHWGLHVRKADTEPAIKLSISLLRDEQARQTASQALSLNSIGTDPWDTESPDLSTKLPIETADSPVFLDTPHSEIAESTVSLGSLHLASYFGLVNSAKVLIEAGIDVDSMDGTNGTSLHWALIESRNKMVGFLLDHGANVNTERDCFSHRRWWRVRRCTLPLSIAAFTGNTQAIETLIRYGAEVDKMQVNDRRTSLFTALNNRKYDAARLLVEKGANVNINPIEFQLATAIGPFETLKMLINGGANEQSVQQALTAAAHTGEIDKVTFLLQQGANADVPEMIEANRDVSVAKSLFGGDVPILTPLVTAITSTSAKPDNDYFRCVVALLENGANVNRVSLRNYHPGCEYGPDSGGFRTFSKFRSTTPLLTASYFGRLDVIRILVQRGVDVNFSLGDQGNALTNALSAGSEDGLCCSLIQTRATVRLLVELGADPALCAPEDEQRIRQLLAMSSEDLQAMAE